MSWILWLIVSLTCLALVWQQWGIVKVRQRRRRTLRRLLSARAVAHPQPQSGISSYPRTDSIVEDFVGKVVRQRLDPPPRHDQQYVDFIQSLDASGEPSPTVIASKGGHLVAVTDVAFDRPVAGETASVEGENDA